MASVCYIPCLLKSVVMDGVVTAVRLAPNALCEPLATPAGVAQKIRKVHRTERSEAHHSRVWLRMLLEATRGLAGSHSGVWDLCMLLFNSPNPNATLQHE